MRQIISLAALLVPICAASAQTGSQSGLPPASVTQKEAPPATKEKSGLEKAIEQALKSNPDLRVAAAKVHEAEAGLSRARLQVTQKVVTAYQAVEVAKATVDIAQKTLERVRALQKTNAVAAEDVRKTEQELTAAKGKLATAQADLNYLLGMSVVTNFNAYLTTNVPLSTGGLAGLTPGTNLSALYGLNTANTAYSPLGLITGSSLGFYPPAQALVLAGSRPAKIAAADKIRKALDRRVTMKFTDTSARSALKMIQKEAEGLHIQAAVKDAAWNENITATLTEVPLGAVLQLLEDTLGDYRTIVRGYGLLIAQRERVPSGAVLLTDFWQGGVKSDAPAANKPAAK
jgi:hypothetical protein